MGKWERLSWFLIWWVAPSSPNEPPTALYPCAMAAATARGAVRTSARGRREHRAERKKSSPCCVAARRAARSSRACTDRDRGRCAGSRDRPLPSWAWPVRCPRASARTIRRLCTRYRRAAGCPCTCGGKTVTGQNNWKGRGGRRGVGEVQNTQDGTIFFKNLI